MKLYNVMKTPILNNNCENLTMNGCDKNYISPKNQVPKFSSWSYLSRSGKEVKIFVPIKYT